MALTRDAVFWDSLSAMTEKIGLAAELLHESLEAPARAVELAGKIKDLEHEADRVSHDVVQALHETWITPLDREEIHTLITSLDDVIDFIDAAGDKIALYEIKHVPDEALELASTLKLCVVDLAGVVAGLKKIKDATALLESVRAISKHEHDVDTIFRRGIARLFKETTDPLEVLKWRDIYETMENAADRAEDVANVVEGIILEHS